LPYPNRTGRLIANVSIVFCLVAVAFGHILAAHMNGDALQIVQNAIEEES